MRKNRIKVARKEKIAIIFDFDDTLTDDTITRLVSEFYDPVRFWTEVNSLVRKGWDPPLAYMKRMTDLAKKGRALPYFTNKKLQDFGKDLDFYAGIPQMFKELRKMIEPEFRSNTNVKIEYYILSSGLVKIIEGSEIRCFLRDFWGCDFSTDSKVIISFPKCAMTFTEKTRCLFQINKSLIGSRYRGKPGKVNEYMSDEKRPIPFSHMIFVGDGLTDIACMSILDGLGGTTFGVFDRPKLKRREYRARSWLILKRGYPLYQAQYDKETPLRCAIEGALLRICRCIQRGER